MKKITDWEKSARVQFPLEFSQSGKLTIVCESNLVKAYINKNVAGFLVVYDVAKFAITEDEDNSEKSWHDFFERWFEKEMMQYGNDKKITEWSETTREQFPGSSIHSDELTIVCKSNSVKAYINKNVAAFLVVYGVEKFAITEDEDNSENRNISFSRGGLKKK